MTLEERFKQNNEKLEKGESKGLSLKDRFNVEAFSASDYANDYLSQAADSDKLAKYAFVMQNADFAEKSQYTGGSGFHLTNQMAHGAYENLNSGNNKDPRNLSWTPNEKAVFNYLYNTEDYKTATQLLLDLTKDSNVRYNEIEKAEAQKRIDNYGNLVGESLLSIPQSVIGGLGQTVFGTSMGLTSALLGEGFSKGWTEAAEMNRLSNAANAVREASTNKIAQDSGNNVAPFLYQTGMSVGDSLSSALIAGGVGETFALLALGGSASQQKTMEVLENGGTAQEAALSGITSGLVEGLTEKVSLGHLTKILKGNAVKGGFKELAKSLAKNMLEEAGEEATSELVNAFTDALILDWTNNIGTESDLKKFYDEQIASGLSESAATEKTIGELVKNTLVSSAGGALGALMSGGVTTGIRTASDYRAGKTTNEYGRTQDIADLARREGREDIAQMIEKNPSNLNVGYAQDALAQEAVDVIRDKKATFEDKAKGIERLNELNEKSSPITGIADKNGKMLHPTAIKWEEGSPVFVTEEGTYKAADVKVTDSASKLINLTEDIPEQARQTFIENYNGENLGDYVNKFEQAYELAKADWQDDLTKMVTDGLLTETQMKNIYKAAQKDVTSESYQLENLKKNIEEKKRLFPDKKIRVKIDTSAVDLTKLNANQRHNVTLAEALAKALGFNLTLFDSTKEQGQRRNINGSYEESTNTISLDINATNSGTHNKGTTNAIITTLSHEITHWSKTNAPGIYKAFRDTTLKTLNENSGQNFSTIGAYVDVNKVAYPGLSDAEVADELVARACENMLQNSEFAKEALGRMTAEEQKTLKDKIVDFFNKIREAIKEIMGRSDSNSLEYRMLKKDADRLAELQKMWDNLIREASSNSAWATEQIEDAEKTSFSLKDPVEKVGGLVAVHNLHEDDFIKTLKLGGFPMPSIAIMKAENAGQNSQYGEISVVFDAETVNPKKGGNVYGLDVWTSTYPKVEYKVNEKKASELFQKAKSWKKPGVYAFNSNKLDSEEVERRLNNEGGVEGLIERLMNDMDLMNTFLAQSGKQVDEYVQTQYRKSLTDSEVKQAEYILNAIPQIKDMTGPERLQYVRENRARLAEIVAESFEDPNVLPGDFSGIEIKDILGKAIRYSVSGRELVRNEADITATNELIKSRVDMAQYKTWLEDLFDGIVEKRGLYNGKERYTESGKERSWDSLHYEETLENVVKAMKLHKNGESFFNAGLLWAAGAKKYKSIEEIRKDANRLEKLPEEEYSKLKEEFGMRMSKISSDLQKHRSSSGNSFIDHDDAMRSILELFIDYNGDIGKIESALKNEYAYKGDIHEIVEETAQLLKEVGNMPTGYFEAKPQKAIPFSNVVAAIVPSNASEELTDLLNQNSIPTELYAPGNDEDRLAKLNDLKGAKFSVKEDSEGNALTEGQADYFADSKIRDKKGNLILVYHGTPSGGFTVFRNGLTYFTANKKYAERYTRTSGSGRTGDSSQIYSGYINITKPFTLDDKEAKRIYIEEFIKGGYAQGMNPYASDAEIRKYASDGIDWNEADNLKDFFDEMGYDYDGIILNEGGDITENGTVMRGDSYVTFSQNQFKDKNNLNPTQNKDIRYSEKDTSIKEQIRDSKTLLDSNGVKASLVVPKSALTDKRSAEQFGINELKKYGTKVDTIDYGTIYFDDIGEIERYANNEIEKLAVGLIPKVLKKGIKVGEHGDHKNRQVETFTIAAKVTINDIPGYMGVTVKRTKNRTHAFRILFNDNLLKVWKELKKDAEGEYEKGSHHKGSLANSAVSASVDKITLNAEKVNEEKVNNEVFSYKDNEGYLHLDADDVLSLDDFEDYLNRVIGRNKRIEAHLRRLNVKIKDNVILNQTKLYEFAKIIKDRYGLTGTYKSIEEELSKAYMKVTDIEGFNKAAESVAEKLIEESRHQDIDPAMIREVEALKKELKGYKIALNDVQKQELANTYGSNWSSHLLGKVRLASDGIKLDELWGTLVSGHPDYFSTITDADEGANLAALLDRLYSGDYNGVRWTKEMTKERTEWLINDIREASWRISDNLTMAEKYDEAMKELRERLKNAKEEVREEAQRKRLITKIVEREDKLITMLRKNDKENHIPDVLKAPLKALLDLVDVQAYVTTEAMANNFNALANALQNVSADYADPEAMDNALKDLTLYFDSNGYFVQNVKDIAAEVQAKVGNALGTTKHNSSILDLSTDSLKKLNEALVAISHAAWNYDKVLAEDTTQRISTRSESTMTFLGQFDNRKAMSDVLKRAISFLAWDNTTPIYGYDRFGNGGKETFRGIMKGDDQLTLNSKVIIDFTKSVFTGQEAEDWSKEIHDLGIGSYKITTAQIMSLYCLNKRQAAKQHLYAAKDLYGKHLEGAVKNVYGEVIDGQGIVIGATKGNEKTVPIKVTKAAVERITSMLTDRQKEVADKLQEFMGTVCADWGNYVTMRRFGIMQFGEDNYFPMQVFRENSPSLPQETVQQASIFKLLNMGFTKSLNERGNGALELNSIFDVFIKHSSEMAAYNAFALPILDAYKWLSYKEEGADGIKSLKTASRLAYGDDGIKFIMNHLEDLNGTSNTATSAEQIVKNVIRRYKTAATAANMRVVLMQPTSYLRAVNEIDSKYLRRAINLNPKTLKATINEMNEKSPLAMKKNGLGAFDVNISRTVAEQALQTKDVKSAKGVFEKAMNISMIAASKADEITWATLYKAVQLETKEKQPELKGDAFDSYVNDRFRDICYRTQVFDSINARSNLMRKKDIGHQMLTAFGSEPTLSYSMLSNNVFLYAVEARNGQYQRAWNKYGKKIKHAFVAFMLSAIAVSAVAAVPDWLRDDEDDKNFIETYFKNFGMNILGEATGLLPYFRDIYSVVVEGYDPSRPDEEILKTARQAWSAMAKAVEDGQITYRTVYQAAKLFSQSTGLPIGNLVRDFKSLWNKTVGEVFGMKIK